MTSGGDAARRDGEQLVCIEFALEFLIRQANLRASGPGRRLNAIENLIARMTGPWCLDRRIEPAVDLRLSSATHAAIAAWVQATEPAAGRDRDRLACYASRTAADERVPTGWIRLVFATECAGREQ